MTANELVAQDPAITPAGVYAAAVPDAYRRKMVMASGKVHEEGAPNRYKRTACVGTE